MRKVFFLAAIVVACAKKEAPPADTATAPPPPPPPPPALTAADIQGTWNATSQIQGDTTTNKFTITSVTDSTGKVTFANKTSVNYTVKLDADSLVATSKPYTDPAMPKGSPKVTFHSIGRVKDGKMSGIVHLMLASKPDSVVATGNWEATKAP